MSTPESSVDALLLIAPGCPHCPAVLEGMGQLVKQGLIGRLQVVNIASHPEVAEELGVRSVPWFRIGEFELEGSHTPAELRQWAELAGREDGVQQYLVQLLSGGQLHRAIRAIRAHPQWLAQAIALLSLEESGISVKTGIGALMEELAGDEILQQQLETLSALLEHEQHGIRADACYFLGLSRSPRALPLLQRCLQDAHPEVREIAREGLEELAQQGIS